jgi:glycosyltransferase involved in cell wall biosynthesis
MASQSAYINLSLKKRAEIKGNQSSDFNMKNTIMLRKNPIMTRLSIVIPLFNEAENVEPLINKIHGVFLAYPFPWELILVDDGSSDGTLEKLFHMGKEYGDHLNIIALQRNFGQTAAMQAGIDAARGSLIATLDGDLQNDPNDIPKLVERLCKEDLDLIVGWRKNRKDNLLIRKIPSWIANRIIGIITGVRLHDYGCSLKVYRASVIKKVRLYGEMHRFIPAWAAIATSPNRITEEVVTHHPREAGKSKYGISRSFRVILDLISVYFFMRHRSKPGHFFGMIGLVFGFCATVILSYLGGIKFFFGHDIGARPLLLVGVVLLISSIQFLTTGVVAELMARTYFESSDVKPYIKKQFDKEDQEALEHQTGWCLPQN